MTAPTFRVCCSNREASAATHAPEGFMVYNLQNGSTYTSIGGFWSQTDDFASDVLDAWYLS